MLDITNKKVRHQIGISTSASQHTTTSKYQETYLTQFRIGSSKIHYERSLKYIIYSQEVILKGKCMMNTKRQPGLIR